jgi:hypothetical protein
MNAFDVLHIHWTALGPAIQKAHQETLQQWQNLPIPDGQKKEAQEVIRTILKKIDEAFALLSDDRQRHSLRDKIIESSQRTFSAELLRQHAEMYLFRGDRAQAKLYIEMALDLMPSKGEYLTILSQCKKG